MFKNYYYARDFNSGDSLLRRETFEGANYKKVKGLFYSQYPYGKNLVVLVAQAKRKLSPNPFGKI